MDHFEQCMGRGKPWVLREKAADDARDLQTI
jgi:hypothetical protein